MEQLTYEQAIAIAQAGEWKSWTDEEVVKFQIYQNRLCMDFSRYHEAIEAVLGRGVWTHEFARMDLLRAEYEGRRPKPTFEETLDILPEHLKVIVLKVE